MQQDYRSGQSKAHQPLPQSSGHVFLQFRFNAQEYKKAIFFGRKYQGAISIGLIFLLKEFLARQSLEDSRWQASVACALRTITLYPTMATC